VLKLLDEARALCRPARGDEGLEQRFFHSATASHCARLADFGN
jgi:hypothetical protein